MNNIFFIHKNDTLCKLRKFSLILICIALIAACKKEIPEVAIEKDRVLSSVVFEPFYAPSSARDSIIFSRVGNIVNNIKIITIFRGEIFGVKNFALSYNGSKLTDCKYTFEKRNHYASGINFKINEKGQVDRISTGNYYSEYYYNDNNEIYKYINNDFGFTSLLKYDEDKNLIEVENNAYPLKKFTYTKYQNPFFCLEKSIVAILAYAHSKFEINYYFSTISRNMPLTVNYYGNDYRLMYDRNSKGDVTRCTLTKKSVVQEEITFYYQ